MILQRRGERSRSQPTCAGRLGAIWRASPRLPRHWLYAGVRPLYDDGSADPSAITRDYTLRVDDEAGTAPVLSVFGGKITTYRRLAEHALEKLAPYFPALKPAWTAAPLPGSDFASRETAKRELVERYRELPPSIVQGVFRRHGAAAVEVLGDGRLGEDYGAGLTEREVAHFMEREWACSAEDVLWRRKVRAAHDRGATRPRRAGGRPMRPLAELDPRGMRAVLLDIDDTLTTGGTLTAQTYGALERLHGAGLRVVPVWGGPPGGATTSPGCGRWMPSWAKTERLLLLQRRAVAQALFRRSAKPDEKALAP